MPYYLCLEGSIVTDGKEVVDKRGDEDTVQQCKSYLDVCCKTTAIIKKRSKAKQ